MVLREGRDGECSGTCKLDAQRDQGFNIIIAILSLSVSLISQFCLSACWPHSLLLQMSYFHAKDFELTFYSVSDRENRELSSSNCLKIPRDNSDWASLNNMSTPLEPITIAEESATVIG